MAESEFGHFDDERREYVITTPKTPLPWINYLGTNGFFSLISNTGGGYSFYRDAKLRRITRYRYNNVPYDNNGRYLYIKDAVNFGQGKNSWLTGTAAWTFVNVSQYICGLKPTLDGLKVDPCVPHEWDGLTLTRKYRGATYVIDVENPDHVQKGVVAVSVDGEVIDGQVLPVAAPGATVHVAVTMG